MGRRNDQQGVARRAACEIEILDIEAHLDARKSEPMTDEPDKTGKSDKPDKDKPQPRRPDGQDNQ
jgi:hypothetical protein